MNARHGVSGLNPAWGEAPPRHARRGGADGTERRTSAPGSDLLGQPPAERRCAARKQRRAGGQPPVGRAGITVRSAVVLRNRGGCRSRRETTLICPSRANPLTSRQCSDPGRTKGDCASGDLKTVLGGEEGFGFGRWKALRSVEAVTLDGAAGKAFLAGWDGPPRAGRNGWRQGASEVELHERCEQLKRPPRRSAGTVRRSSPG